MQAYDLKGYLPFFLEADGSAAADAVSQFMLWETVVTSHGATSELEAVLPALVAQASSHLHSSGQQPFRQLP